jgi:hypothetical protein
MASVESALLTEGRGPGPAKTESGGGPEGVLKTVGGRSNPFRTAEFIGSGLTLNRKGETTEIQEKTRNFKERDLGLIVDDIASELAELARMQTGDAQDQAEFREIMAHQAFRLQKEFFDKFTNSEDGRTGKVVDVVKLREWVTTDRGLQDAYHLAIMRSEMIGMHSGALADMDKPFRRKNIPQPEGIETTDVSTREGFLLREAARGIKLWMQEDNADTTGRKTPILGMRKKGTVGAAVAGLTIVTGGTGVLAYGALGVLGGGLPPVAAGIARSFRAGGRVSIEASKQALQIAKTDDPVMQAWARRNGFDVRNLTFKNGRLVKDKIVLDPYIKEHGIANPSIDPVTAAAILLEQDRLIRAMHEQMGVPERLRAGMDNQFLRKGHEHSLQRGIISEDTVVTELKKVLKDHDNNPCMVNIAPAGAPEVWKDNTKDFFAHMTATNPAFLAAHGITAPFDRENMTPDENIAAWKLKREIRIRLSHEAHKRNWDEWKESKSKRAKNMRDKVDAAIRAEGDGSKSVEKIEKKLTFLKADAETLPRLSKPFETFESSMSELERKEEKIQEILSSITDAGGNPIALKDIEQQMSDILSTLKPPGGRVRTKELIVDGVQVTSVFDALAEIEQLVTDDMNTWDTANPRPALPVPLGANPTDAEKKQHAKETNDHNEWPEKRKKREEALRSGDRVKGIQEEIAEIKRVIGEKRTALREARAAERVERMRLLGTGPENTVRNESNKAAGSMRSALATIEGWTVVGPVIPPLVPIDLSRDAVGSLTAPVTVEELFSRINTANKQDSKVGWPESANDDPANRELLLRAMVEARIEPPTDEYTQAVDPNYWGLTEYDLLLMDAADIKAAMDRRSPRLPGNPPSPDVAEIDALKVLAQERFSERREAFEELRFENEVRQRELTNEKANVSAEGGKNPELATIDRILGRYADIREVVSGLTIGQLVEALDSAKAKDRDPNADASGKGEKYLASERADDHTVAYDNILQWLGDHRSHTQDGIKFKGETGRDAAFKRNAALISEEVLRDQLFQWDKYPRPAGLLGHPPPPATFVEAIDSVRNEIANGKIAPEDFAAFLTEKIIFGFMEPRVDRL